MILLGDFFNFLSYLFPLSNIPTSFPIIKISSWISEDIHYTTTGLKSGSSFWFVFSISSPSLRFLKENTRRMLKRIPGKCCRDFTRDLIRLLIPHYHHTVIIDKFFKFVAFPQRPVWFSLSCSRLSQSVSESVSQWGTVKITLLKLLPSSSSLPSLMQSMWTSLARKTSLKDERERNL